MCEEAKLDPISIALRAARLNVTVQRVEVARVFFGKCVHLSAEQVHAAVNNGVVEVSKATIYNTLKVFVQTGILREVVVDPTRVFYDSNITQHHHIYNTETGELSDIPADAIRIDGLPVLPSGLVASSVEIIVRTRRAK